MNLPTDIVEYHAKLEPNDLAICIALATEITGALPEATAKVWHAHPVWFIEGNPIVGYDRLKHSLRLMFWSGQSFPTPGLVPEGSFRAAEIRYTDVSEVDTERVAAWLADSRAIQWDYEHIRTNRGLVKRTEFTEPSSGDAA